MTIGTAGVPLTGDPNIDTLLGATQWATSTLTVGFPVAGSSWTGYDANGEPFSGFTPLTGAQQQAVGAALSSWSRVANITFVPVTEPGQEGEIRFAGTSKTATSEAYYPYAAPIGGDVWFGPRLTGTADWIPGHYEFQTAVHELGHALGLKHPQDTLGGTVADPAQDSIELSVMSYRSYPGAPLNGTYTLGATSYPTGPMLNDVAAIQELYGANYTTNAGDDVYRFTPDQGVLFQTVWDGGGNDTYDLSAYTTGVSVTLAPGGWSSLSSAQLAQLNIADPTAFARGNIANAYLHDGDPRSLIESAAGGAGNDTLVGNQTGNVLVGGGGADTLILPADGVTDQIGYIAVNDGSSPGVSAGFDQITGFETGVDKIVLAGGLRALLDDNLDGLLSGGDRATGQINMAIDEAVRLTVPVASLVDAGYASLIAAMGPLVPGTEPADHDLLAIASDGLNSGLYLIGDANADYQLAATDIRLLGLFGGNATLGVGDLAFV
ncbi:M10 family metallopeptidase [Azospirillum agricola]|uniref:M10 family metallopeptidase n=1 Tax=Azospirillum agricola TaxID=1720247 RepID=UPI000A0F0F26|nr:M10 family metallopeptidase [Azospirillum agricola]SMH41427.1 Peptidase M10 serralysin C terminal [Azospirillum lipoferum]